MAVFPNNEESMNKRRCRIRKGRNDDAINIDIENDDCSVDNVDDTDDELLLHLIALFIICVLSI